MHHPLHGNSLESGTFVAGSFNKHATQFRFNDRLILEMELLIGAELYFLENNRGYEFYAISYFLTLIGPSQLSLLTSSELFESIEKVRSVIRTSIR